MEQCRIAWLAGLWDGEGSIGLSQVTPTYFIVQAQISMTCGDTLAVVEEVLAELDVKCWRGDRPYREKKPHHKPAYRLHLHRMDQVKRMGEAVLPYSVTKRELWMLVLEWIDRRTEAAGGLNEQGQVKRGGRHRTPYTADELALAERIRGRYRRSADLAR